MAQPVSERQAKKFIRSMDSSEAWLIEQFAGPQVPEKVAQTVLSLRR
jgi:hypothetical protein